MLCYLTGVVVASALILGGGTKAGFLSDVIVQGVGSVLLLVSAWSLRHSRSAGWRPPYGVMCFCGLLFVVPLLQLVPLPGGLRGGLGSDPAVAAGIAGMGFADWRSLSVAPFATWAAAVSMIPALAVAAAVVQLNAHERMRLAQVLIIVGGVGLLIGFAQVAQGPGSPLRFFEFTNVTEAVGFFANRNHFATLLSVMLVFSAVGFCAVAMAVVRPGALGTNAILWFCAYFAFLLTVLSGLALARSRAGIVLAMVAVVGVVALVGSNSRMFGSDAVRSSQGGRGKVGRLALGVLVITVLMALQVGLHRIMTRFETDPLEDLRVPLAITTIESAMASLPFGTGLGSFVQVYALAEKPGSLFAGYANRAHNDLAELLLETGAVGGLLLAVFLVWFFGRILLWWRSAASSADTEASVLLARAATLAVALMLAHSLVDYPLRTTAMAVVFGFSCALLIPGPPATAAAGGGARERSEEPRQPPRTGRAAPPRVQWGQEGVLPESWRPKEPGSR